MLSMPGCDLLNEVAAELRQRLDCPEGWIEVFADEAYGNVVGIALTMSIEDVGNGESGPVISASPGRFIYLSGVNERRWVLDVYDNSLSDNATSSYEAETLSHVAALTLGDIAGSDSYSEIASHVGDILEVLGVQFKEV